MKKIKLKLSRVQWEALIFMCKAATADIKVFDIHQLALKELYFKLSLKLQMRMFTIKNLNSLTLSSVEAYAIDELMFLELFTGFELSTLKFIIREIEQQVVNM